MLPLDGLCVLLSLLIRPWPATAVTTASSAKDGDAGQELHEEFPCNGNAGMPADELPVAVIFVLVSVVAELLLALLLRSTLTAPLLLVGCGMPRCTSSHSRMP